MQLKLPFWHKKDGQSDSQATDHQSDDNQEQEKASCLPREPIRFFGLVFDGNDLVAGRSYWFLLIGLVVLLLSMGVLTNLKIQERHRLYRELSEARQNYQKMQIEEQRLMIEQQTFSSTPTVAQRAVSELGMFYPTEKHRLIVTEPNQ